MIFENDSKFFTIKQQKLGILLIQEITSSNQLEDAIEEKKLLEIMNVTVSHEMRNPLNSIQNQNMVQKQLIEKLPEPLRKQFTESASIQSASTKILNSLVSDILDISQIKAGKFRKDCNNFDVKEATQEIIMIQLFKAQMMGI